MNERRKRQSVRVLWEGGEGGRGETGTGGEGEGKGEGEGVEGGGMDSLSNSYRLFSWIVVGKNCCSR